MDIDRKKHQGDIEEARKRIKFCLDKIEEIESNPKIEECFWSMTIGKRLTYEEVVGALVCAEQNLKESKFDIDIIAMNP